MTAPPRSRVAAGQLRVRLIASADEPSLQAFGCGDPDLDDFLRTDALRLQAQRVASTYLAFFEEELVAYMTLLTDAVVLETKERKRLALTSRDHPSVPAIKIARLAVHESFRATHAGGGTALLRIAHALALDIANRVGCRLLTLDAYPAALPFYEKLGFVVNRSKTYEGRQRPSMRLDIFPLTPHSWA
jgi:GNAT superfamily N-acetyltransferase